MSLDEQETRFRAMDKWFFSDQGLNVAQAFSSELTRLNELIHGDALLQLGSCGDNLLFCALRYRHKWLATPYMSCSTSLVTSLNQLPFGRNSVDCVLAPLTLDSFSHDKNPIDEIDRVLKPLGYVVFFGINPLSLWGYWLRFSETTCFGREAVIPKSVFFIKRAMMHRGYIQCHLSNFYYIPPVSNKRLINRLEILNEIGKMISPIPAGFYCLVVQKHEENLIPLLPIRTSAVVTSLQPTC